ncbi:helix-turn-helix transcriptional regulator [Hymenobacter sp. BT188]|uniref:helix-turn-helix transcriptional regulator n=1 Tax=Hymenobacter sp. BT188 TaxID=2763504 RepID=UPI00165119BC|nr:helix-turn-helix transcriptional regulator [Hymenobacter sp. BT188]MBC6605733.1 helix-turn-helix transcriptional regulator [Hymenobacter sp. BT188]
MAINTTVGQRFSEFITYLGISKNAFAASLDKTATVIQHLVDERNKPGFDLLCKVFEVYPNLSKDWLLQGVGPMIADELGAENSKPIRGENNSSKPAPAKEKPPVAAVSAPAAISISKPAEDIFSPKMQAVHEPTVASSAPVAAASQLQMPETAVAVVPVPTPANSVDTSWQTALYTQQMAHQLAMAEMRNQHLQEQQRLMQQMLDLMQRKM